MTMISGISGMGPTGNTIEAGGKANGEGMNLRP